MDNGDGSVSSTSSVCHSFPDASFMSPVHKKRRIEVGAVQTSQLTSSERNKKARQRRAEKVEKAREFMQQNTPLPVDVQEAYDAYERDKKRSREYQRNKRASEKTKISTSEQQDKLDTPASTSTTEIALSRPIDMSTLMLTFWSALEHSAPSPFSTFDPNSMDPTVPQTSRPSLTRYPASSSGGPHPFSAASIGPPLKSVSKNIPLHVPESSPCSSRLDKAVGTTPDPCDHIDDLAWQSTTSCEKMVDTHGLRSFSEKAVGRERD